MDVDKVDQRVDTLYIIFRMEFPVRSLNKNTFAPLEAPFGVFALHFVTVNLFDE